MVGQTACWWTRWSPPPPPPAHRPWLRPASSRLARIGATGCQFSRSGEGAPPGCGPYAVGCSLRVRPYLPGCLAARPRERPPTWAAWTPPWSGSSAASVSKGRRGGCRGKRMRVSVWSADRLRGGVGRKCQLEPRNLRAPEMVGVSTGKVICPQESPACATLISSTHLPSLAFQFVPEAWVAGRFLLLCPLLEEM